MPTDDAAPSGYRGIGVSRDSIQGPFQSLGFSRIKQDTSLGRVEVTMSQATNGSPSLSVIGPASDVGMVTLSFQTDHPDFGMSTARERDVISTFFGCVLPKSKIAQDWYWDNRSETTPLSGVTKELDGLTLTLTVAKTGEMRTVMVFVANRDGMNLLPRAAAGSTTNSPKESPSKSDVEAVRADLLEAMRRRAKKEPFVRAEVMVDPFKAKGMKYGASEDWAKTVFGEPWRERRDGQGGHIYIWAGNDVVLHAIFHNAKCSDFRILDEADVKVMQIEP